MNKKRVSIVLGLGIGILAFSGGLILTNEKPVISTPKYLEMEYTVQKQVVNTFGLDTNNLKSLFLRDIYDDNIATESSEVRGKISEAINILKRDGDLGVGDFKPMAFLKGNTVLIAVKHKDNTITLEEFDISKQEHQKINKQIKEVKN